MYILRSLIKKCVGNYFLSCRNMSSAKKLNHEVPIVYGDQISPPVRFVMMTASFLDVKVNFHKIDLFKNENKNESYRKINPLEKVPAMVTKDATICDSHAISLYLCQLAGTRGLGLYPADPVLQARVNQMLFFNSSTLFRVDSEIMTMFFAGKWTINDKKVEEWILALDYLEHRLESKPWLAGDKMLLCDLCAVTVVTSMLPLLPMTKRHNKINKWMRQFEDIPCYEINKRGLTTIHSCIESVKSNYTVRSK